MMRLPLYNQQLSDRTGNGNLRDRTDDTWHKYRRRRRHSFFPRAPWQPSSPRLRLVFQLLSFLVISYLLIKWYSHKVTWKDFGDASPLDIVVGGWPKCGTTTLLQALVRHPDIQISDKEECDYRLAGAAVTTSSKMRGIKCPTKVLDPVAVHRIYRYSTHVKWIIGIRHPVRQVESFYNYRVTELYDQNQQDSKEIPSLRAILDGTTTWKGISAASHRYEQYLATLVEGNYTNAYSRGRKPWWPTAAHRDTPVFLYTVEQLWRHDIMPTLQHFLGLGTPLASLGRENTNHFVGANAHKESVDLCAPAWDDVRHRLVEDAARAAAWLRENLRRYSHVVTPPGWDEALMDWHMDPCANRTVNASQPAVYVL